MHTRQRIYALIEAAGIQVIPIDSRAKTALTFECGARKLLYISTGVLNTPDEERMLRAGYAVLRGIGQATKSA